VYVYAVLLVVGFFGIVAMALSGFAAGGAIRTGKKALGKFGGIKTGLRSYFSFSLIDVFSFAMGAGFLGLLFRPYVPKEQTIYYALVGGIVFDLLITKVILFMLSRFIGEESQGLEGSVAFPGVAVSSFDSSGRGLIKLTLDGQIVQLLATLEEHERRAGVQVKKGDALMVVEVDPTHNECKVVKDLTEEPPDSPL
jgi:hypothetical protein